jgi:hypothetical protein
MNLSISIVSVSWLTRQLDDTYYIPEVVLVLQHPKQFGGNSIIKFSYYSFFNRLIRLVTTPSTGGAHFFGRRTGGSEFEFAFSALQMRHVIR